VFAEKENPSFPLRAPIEAKLHTGQAAELSNGVNIDSLSIALILFPHSQETSR